MGREAGITEEQLRSLSEYRASNAFSALEKLVLDYTREMTRTPVDVSEQLFSALRHEFTEAQLVELTAVIAWENYRARFDHAFGIESQNFSENAYCPLPVRAFQTSASADRAV